MDNFKIVLSANELNYEDCLHHLTDPKLGGISIFDGRVRNHNRGENVTHLFFECYEPMAILEMESIAEEASSKFAVSKIYMSHRLGNVKIMESAVLLGASSVHRAAAIDACTYLIDELKNRVPIWKKEFTSSGAIWINSTP